MDIEECSHFKEFSTFVFEIKIEAVLQLVYFLVFDKYFSKEFIF